MTSIECPSCSHELGHDDMVEVGRKAHVDLYALAPDEGQAEITCPNCDVTFHVNGGYTPHYKAALDEDYL